MKPVNEMRLRFNSHSVNESFARATVAAFVAQMDPDVEVLTDLRTAVSEAVTNAIVHAYPNTLGPINLTVQLFENGWITIRVQDRGQGIENVQKAMEPLYTTGGEDRSGLGFSMMESCTDRLLVRSHPGRGTIVTMKKYIPSRAAQKP